MDGTSNNWDYFRHREALSYLGWALFTLLVSATVVEVIALVAMTFLAPQYADSLTFWGMISLVSVYGVGFPVACLMIRAQKIAPCPTQKKPLSVGNFFKAYTVVLAALYLSNYLTLMVTDLIGQLRGIPVTNPVDSLLAFPMWLSIVFSCVVAPLWEEFLFRGMMLRRLRPYGDHFAILASSLCFGIFHGTLSQLPYAFCVGVVFAYVAIKTESLWQVMLLHAMVNAISIIIIPLLTPLGDLGDIILMVFIFVCVILGMYFFWQERKNLSFAPNTTPFTTGQTWKLLGCSAGILFFTLVAILSMIFTL